ncbi:aminoacyl-tRNA deacylase [Stackebrandtia nassauensis]|uniref:YbaK/prolyl-tRNA synthetase associated region n=1 Tax=Stackebrandtia nassauensis (strain DSM 44728 / CIP 108903 / NRRL B-16338 / NBRC 102104 / LLR-40K-21) TaxID=446470 RepID=D3PWY6_STANL|nr:YbaK/EbsC family protein [Stackebrandtia nassauensis]ADD45210.1 YbaK/prolyl-tRNA synthetase associated region [Stackebrandtia nassauensis DSM 44728]
MNATPLPDAVRAMVADGEAHGVDVEVRVRPAANSLPEAAEILGLTPADLAKTLVVRKTSDSYLFAIVPGDRSIAWPKLRELLGTNRLSMPDAATALAATGYERGTITPIGSHRPWPIYVDSRLRGRRVAMGAGAHGFSAFVDVDRLVDGYDAVLADITD